MARRRKRLPTVAVTASIDSLSHEGRGIAHINNKTTFIRGALPGEEVSFKYTNQRSKFDEGCVVEILNASRQRVTPPCKHFGLCGGCSMQHLDAESQILHKQSVLLEQLMNAASLTPETVLAPLTGPQLAYRRKARLGVKYVLKKQKLLVGFREVQSNFIADIEQCEVLHPLVGKRLRELQTLINDLSIRDKIPQLEVAIADHVVIIIRHLAPLSEEDLQRLNAFEEDYRISLYLQPAGPDSIEKLNNKVEQPLYYQLPEHDISIYFSAANFTQVNFTINELMIDKAIEFLHLNEQDQVLDLFCGLGNFTLPMARYCHTVTGVEGDARLVERARQNAEYNHINNAEFIAMDLAQEDMQAAFLDKHYNKLLLDPARSGADKILQRLTMDTIEIIVYISCNPATLARDAGILVNEKGFRLKQAGVMDMFPHTSHVESIAVFTR